MTRLSGLSALGRSALGAAAALLVACGGGQSDTDMRAPADSQGVASTMATQAPDMATLIAQATQHRRVASLAVTATSAQTTALATAAGPSPAYPDLIWRNDSTGDTRSWTMDGLGNLRTHPLLTSRDWRLTHVADLNGDGQQDLIWENAVMGKMAAWLMNGPDFTEVAFSKMLLEELGWKVAHIADFDGDGRDDLVYYNEGTGQTVMWLMEGLTVRDVAELARPGSRAVVTGVGDFDGDGRSDLLWRNEAGQREIWLMDGATRRRTLNNLPAPGLAQDQSTVPLIIRATTARPASLLYRSNSVTEWGTFAMQEAHLAPGTERWVTQNIALRWPGGAGISQTLAAADLNGSGEPGYLVTSGAGLEYVAPGGADATPMQDPTWTVAQVLDLDRDGKDDIVWRDLNTGEHSLSLMDGTRFKNTMGPLMGGGWRLTGVRLPELPPLARISANATPSANSRTVLDGLPSRSRGPGALSYAWTLDVPPGSQARLTDPTAAQPTFTPDVPGAYLARLVVTRQGIRSAASWVAMRVPYPAGELATVSIAPLTTSQLAAITTLEIDPVLTHGLKAGDLLHIDFPSIWGDPPRWLNPGLDGYDPSFQQIAPFEFHALVGNELQLRYSPGTGTSGDKSPAVVPAGQRLPSPLSLRMRNPTVAGSYTVRLWTSADPTPVSVAVRYRTKDSAPAGAGVTVATAPAPGQPSVSLALTTTSGLPRGARVTLRLPLGFGVESLALPMRNATVLAEAGRASNEILYTVLDDSLASAGSQLTVAQTGLNGPLYTCSSPPASTAFVRTSDDLTHLAVELLPVPNPQTAITDLSAGSRRDAQGRWVLSPSFRSVKGLPAGATVYLLVQDQVDWAGSRFVPDPLAPCSLSNPGYAVGRTTLTSAVPPNGLVQFAPLSVLSSIQARDHALVVLTAEDRAGGTVIYTEPSP